MDSTLALSRESAAVQPRRRRRPLPLPFGQLLLYVLLVALSVVALAPLILMVLGSFKTPAEVTAYPPTLFPRRWLWENYVAVWQELPLFPRWFLNSVVLSLAVTGLNVFLSALAGYALARLRFPGRDAIFVAVLATLMIPLAVQLIPRYLLLNMASLINTYVAVILPNISTGVGIFLMTQFMKGIPRELEEAAVIDGAGRFSTFWRVILPLSQPAMVALAIYSFKGQWNDFLWPLVVLNSNDMWTLPVGLSGLASQVYQANLNWILVGSVFTTLPMVVVFFLFQRHFVQGITTTGFK